MFLLVACIFRFFPLRARSFGLYSIGKRVDLVNQLISISEALHDAIPCAHCRAAISRISGCNHMLCRNCGKGFCYGCGKPLYNHKSEQCIRDQELKSVRQADVVKQIQKEVMAPGVRNYLCPSCHQQNPKMGNNNHIFCWACQVHYCALCRRWFGRARSTMVPGAASSTLSTPRSPQQKKDGEPGFQKFREVHVLL